MRGFFAFVVLTACHFPRAPTVAGVPGGPPSLAMNDVNPEPPPVPVDPCEGSEGVVVSAPAIELQCKDEYRRCRGTTTFSVRNCSAAPVEFIELKVRLREGSSLTMTPAESLLRPGASWAKDSTFMRGGSHSVIATLRVGDGLLDTDPVELRIDNPTRDAALKACEACNGRWGVYGMRSKESCNCTTTDGGTVCRDGNDCEASCMFERFEVVQRGSLPSEHEGSGAYVPELGRPVGRCNEREMSFGCKARIRAGASTDDAVDLPAHAPVQCVD